MPVHPEEKALPARAEQSDIPSERGSPFRHIEAEGLASIAAGSLHASSGSLCALEEDGSVLVIEHRLCSGEGRAPSSVQRAIPTAHALHSISPASGHLALKTPRGFEIFSLHTDKAVLTVDGAASLEWLSPEAAPGAEAVATLSADTLVVSSLQTAEALAIGPLHPTADKRVAIKGAHLALLKRDSVAVCLHGSDGATRVLSEFKCAALYPNTIFITASSDILLGDTLAMAVALYSPGGSHLFALKNAFSLPVRDVFCPSGTAASLVLAATENQLLAVNLLYRTPCWSFSKLSSRCTADTLYVSVDSPAPPSVPAGLSFSAGTGTKLSSCGLYFCLLFGQVAAVCTIRDGSVLCVFESSTASAIQWTELDSEAALVVLAERSLSYWTDNRLRTLPLPPSACSAALLQAQGRGLLLRAGGHLLRCTSNR